MSNGYDLLELCTNTHGSTCHTRSAVLTSTTGLMNQHHQGSNRAPLGSQANALPLELWAHGLVCVPSVHQSRTTHMIGTVTRMLDAMRLRTPPPPYDQQKELTEHIFERAKPPPMRMRTPHGVFWAATFHGRTVSRGSTGGPAERKALIVCQRD